MPQGVPIELPPPLGGVRGDVVPYQIPPGYLWRSLNVLERYGRLRTRQGLRPTAAAGPGSRIVGGQAFTTAAGVDQTVAATPSGWWRLGPAAWVDISGSVLTGSVDDPARFVVFPSSGINWLVGVNNANVPQKWNGVAGTFVPVGGSPPIAKDITVASNFIVLGNVVESGVRSPSRIRVSNFNDLDLWTQYGPADLTDSNDDIVAVRGLTRTTFAVHKSKSIWLGYAQLGLFPFQFERMEVCPGPCSPAAVVQVDQEHYVLSTDLRVRKFNGSKAVVVSEPVEYYLQTAGLPTTFRSVNRARAWGVYDALNRVVWFCFPGPMGPDPMVAITLDIDTGTIHPHVFPFPITAGWEGHDISSLSWDDLLIYADWLGGAFEATYPDWDSFGGTLEPTSFIGSVAGQVYRQRYLARDDTYDIPVVWEFPLKPWLGLQHHTHLDGVESFFQQQTGGPIVRIDVGVSDALAEVVDPVYTTIGHHNTALASRQKFTIPNLDMRFWSIRFGAAGSLQFLGGMANAWPEEVPESGSLPQTMVNVLPLTVTPTAGLESVIVTGAFATDYMVAIETSWPTMYGISGKTATQFTITLGTPVPAGGVIRCKVITS